MRGVSHGLNVDIFFLIFLKTVKIFFKSAILGQKTGCLKDLLDRIYKIYSLACGGASRYPTDVNLGEMCGILRLRRKNEENLVEKTVT